MKVTRPPDALFPPRRTQDGALVVDGWTAWTRLDGKQETGRWDDIIEAGVRFCEVTKTVPCPSFLNSRQDPWAEADRIAWEEQSADSLRHVPFVNKLLDMRRPLDEPAQLIHGDLTGNVLLRPGDPPAVIDVSPYWRPKSYATAIIIADALAWEDAPLTWARGYLVDLVLQQAFVRALLFPIVTDHLRAATAPGISTAYERPFKLICQIFGRNDS